MIQIPLNLVKEMIELSYDGGSLQYRLTLIDGTVYVLEYLHSIKAGVMNVTVDETITYWVRSRQPEISN